MASIVLKCFRTSRIGILRIVKVSEGHIITFATRCITEKLLVCREREERFEMLVVANLLMKSSTRINSDTPPSAH